MTTTTKRPTRKLPDTPADRPLEGGWLNLGCGTHRAPPPWVNIDVVERNDVHPDVIVTPGKPLPLPDGIAEKVYCGHVLEHMPWPDTLAYLQDVRRVLEPGGELLVVGPDVIRAIHRWRDGLEPWEIVKACLEHADDNPGFETSDWPNARHWWNCYSARAAELVEQAGFEQVVEEDISQIVVWDGWKPPWPVVGMSAWQFCVSAQAPPAIQTRGRSTREKG